MARMHPEDIDDLENATPGERTVFRFLRETARPDSDFIGWYGPAIGEQGREPDFVLFGKQARPTGLGGQGLADRSD